MIKYTLFLLAVVASISTTQAAVLLTTGTDSGKPFFTTSTIQFTITTTATNVAIGFVVDGAWATNNTGTSAPGIIGSGLIWSSSNASSGTIGGWVPHTFSIPSAVDGYDSWINNGSPGGMPSTYSFTAGDTLTISGGTFLSNSVDSTPLFPTGNYTIYLFGSGGSLGSSTTVISSAAVPEPATYALAVLGALAIAARFRRAKS